MTLTVREKEILEIIKDNPTISREKMAESLGISSSAIGTHIHNLTNKGYLLGKGYIVAPERKVVVVGGSNIDLKGYASGHYLSGTSNPGRLTESMGGVGRNIAENLGILDQPTILLSAVGQDHYGQQIIEQTKKPSLNLEYVIRSANYRTGTYLAHLNLQGELIGAIADMEILRVINSEYLHKHRQIIERASILIFDTNLMEKTIHYLLQMVADKDITIVADPVSVSKSKKLQGYLDKINILTPNLDEALVLFNLSGEFKGETEIKTILSRITRVYKEKKLNTTMVISLGRKGVFTLNPEFAEIIPAIPIKVEDIVETTGAGDALTAGMVYGLLAGKGIKDAVKLGLKAAQITIMSERTVNLKLKQKLVIEEGDN